MIRWSCFRCNLVREKAISSIKKWYFHSIDGVSFRCAVYTRLQLTFEIRIFQRVTLAPLDPLACMPIIHRMCLYLHQRDNNTLPGIIDNPIYVSGYWNPKLRKTDLKYALTLNNLQTNLFEYRSSFHVYYIARRLLGVILFSAIGGR